MITLKQWMETVNYAITEGYNYQWQCYGANAYGLESWNGKQDGASFSIIFDQIDQTVYQVEAHDMKNNRSYRMINPLFAEAHSGETASRGMTDVAYDDVKFTDLETDEDFLEKAAAIFIGLPYDDRISIPVDLPDNVLFSLMKQAHEQDITLNQLMENVLKEAIESYGVLDDVNS